MSMDAGSAIGGAEPVDTGELLSPDASRPEAGPAGRVTPMMAQYHAIKAAHPDCLLFYRMGDFFELFFADAEIASRVLGIALTKRGKHDGADIPMCGVPVERSDDYLHRLIAAGHRVAVCEQTEDPAEAKKRGGKSVVARAVVRLVTPGTLTEERLLDPGRPNYLAAVARRRNADATWCYGVASVDISTGRFAAGETDGVGLAAELARLDPREVVIADTVHDDPELKPLWRDLKGALTPVPRDGLDPASAERRLREFFAVATLDSFGDFTPAEIAAAGTALAYVERTQLGGRPNLSPPSRTGRHDILLIDPATRANLELTRTTGGDKAGSLLAAIDRTVTAGGARLLAERLAGPVRDLATIRDRQDAVAALADDRILLDRLRAELARAPDMPRALGRLRLGRGGPRDLACLRDGLTAAGAVVAILEARRDGGATTDLPDELERAHAALSGLDGSLREALESALAEELPLAKRDGGFIRDGFDPALDEARLLAGDSRRVIAALQARYAAETGCRTLRVKHNNVLGYFIEVPQAVGEEFLRGGPGSPFIHRQSMSGAMRFTIAELGELEGRISAASDRALRLEVGHFDTLLERALAASDAVTAAADALAALDVAASAAVLATECDWTRPVVDDSLAFRIERGRHPVVEAALRRDGEPFIANGCDLSGTGSGRAGGGRISLITGPNMGGKSTFLRQNAVIAILAQAGLFVPAASAHIGVVDRLFSRVGAADDLARGRSTFMVEMVETAAILNQASERSLVVLDEIGRGTATFDGLSIAWGAIEHLHDVNRCRAIFATHFHELTALADRLSRVANATLRVTEWNGDVVFLHEVVPGAADRSYGLQVARLAGLPVRVLDRARTVLRELERSDRERPRTALLDDLPLFAAARPVPEPSRPMPADPLRDALAAIDPDELTPREALEALYRLKSVGSERQH